MRAPVLSTPKHCPAAFHCNQRCFAAAPVCKVRSTRWPDLGGSSQRFWAAARSFHPFAAAAPVCKGLPTGTRWKELINSWQLSRIAPITHI